MTLVAEDGGSPIFRQPRVGTGRVPFEIVQLRTMRELMTDLGPQVMGRARPTGDGRFPLLADGLSWETLLRRAYYSDEGMFGTIARISWPPC